MRALAFVLDHGDGGALIIRFLNICNYFIYIFFVSIVLIEVLQITSIGNEQCHTSRFSIVKFAIQVYMTY